MEGDLPRKIVGVRSWAMQGNGRRQEVDGGSGGSADRRWTGDAQGSGVRGERGGGLPRGGADVQTCSEVQSVRGVLRVHGPCRPATSL